MTSKISRAEFFLRSRSKAFASREQRTLEWLRERLRGDCYLSWSAGKDSMVMVHLCRRIRTDLPILCADTGVPYRWTQDDKDHITEWTDKQGWQIRYFHWNKWGDKSLPGDNLASYRAHVHASQFTELNGWAARNSRERRVDGMRAQEGGSRAIFLRTCRGESSLHLSPLWQWDTRDVWAYLIKYDIPWLSIYDHVGPNARNGIIGRNGEAYGRFVYLRRYYPAEYQLAKTLLHL